VAKLSCKKTLELKSISAIAARDIAEGEMLSFDTNGDSEDLTIPQKATSRPRKRSPLYPHFLFLSVFSLAQHKLKGPAFRPALLMQTPTIDVVKIS
jgi:hypothetical protein